MSAFSDPNSFEKAFGRPKKLFLMMGINLLPEISVENWKDTVKNKCMEIYSIFLSTNHLILLVLLSLLIYQNIKDGKQIFEASMLLDFYAVYFMKTIIIMKRKLEVRDLLIDVKSQYLESSSKSNALDRILKFYLPFQRFSIILLSTIVSLSVVGTLVRDIIALKNGGVVDAGMNLPYDHRPLYLYIPLMAFRVYTGFHTVLWEISNDGLFYGFVIALSAEFEALADDFGNLDYNNDFIGLKKLILKHQELIKLTNRLESLFSFSTFLTFVTSSLMICFTIIQLYNVNYWTDYIVYTLPIANILNHIFFYCYFCEQLQTSYSMIVDKIMMSNWYESKDKNVMNAIQIITMKANIPINLTAMGFRVIDIQTFTNFCEWEDNDVHDISDVESAEENVEQDDSMERSNDVNDENTYVSHYPDSRRYSMANAMATNRPQYCLDNQGYSVNTTQEADDNLDSGNKETKIDIPPSNPPQYSAAVADKTLDKKVKRFSIHGMMEEEGNVLKPHQEIAALSLEEKRFLLAVERGDVATTRRMLQKAQETGYININCVDPLGRSALLMAIDNENLEMVELLINHRVDTKDALLHAISEEFVEAVEVLLDHEDCSHRDGEPHSWEALPNETATFTPDITPLILAAHRDNYEIIKILLDRGSTLPLPHDVRCGCDECVTSRQEDSLRHSRSRINAYRALASPSLIALSSKDPILTAFELSWELRRLSFLEHEFKNEYMELRKQCQDFATALLDHTRSSHELEVLLNHDPTGPAFEHGERMHLNRLKLAVKLRQKKFVSHPNVQQLLASIWYEGLPGFRRKNMALQSLEICRIGIMFPLFSVAYVIAPHSSFGQTMRKPFIKFICHSASYFTFLFLLMLASQRIESVMDFSGEITDDELPTKRGAAPTLIEWMILSWVSGLIWSEVKQLWDVGLQEYVHDMWNVIDFITNSLYVATVALRVVSYFQVQKEMAINLAAADLPREKWDTWDPMLISEGLFSAGNIFSSLKLVYIFSVNPHLGPLQVSLSRMVTDIIKFFFLYVLVLFAFSSGLNQLLWYYADMEKKRCPEYSPLSSTFNGTADPNACIVWRRFTNLFETTQTLFWAAFGLIDLDSFELDGIKIFTRFWGMLMFGCYSVINIVVLLNLLIAMMNHSYQLISERADTEWKFARSKLWISYFEEGATCPPPFNIIPTPKSLLYFIQWLKRKFFGQSKAIKKEHMKTIRKVKQASERDFRYQSIMRNLVRRYVTVQQRKAESQGVTEDDVNEIKQDISAFRCELVEILKNSGMNTSTASGPGGAGGKKNRQKERRLMKGFNVAPSIGSTSLTPLSEHSGSFPLDHHGSHELSGFSGLFAPGIIPRKNTGPNPLQQQQQQLSTSQSSFGDSINPIHKLSRFAPKFHSKRNGGSHKRKWGTLIEAAKSGSVSRFIGRSRSEDSVCNSPPPMHNRNESASNSPNSEEAVTESPTDSNPSLDKPDVEHHHTHHKHHNTRQPTNEQHKMSPNNDNNSNVHNSSHNSNSSNNNNNNKKDHHHLHMPHVNLNFSALAALKRKRKKFSNSRNESPVLEPPPEHSTPSSSIKKSLKKTLQRASSVPTRSTVPEKRESFQPRHEQTQSQDRTEVSQDLSEVTPMSASTTEESVAPTSTEPLLNIARGSLSMASNIKFEINGQQTLPNLPNIIPLQGHLHQQGWL